MKSKKFKIAVIVTITFFFSVICLYCFQQGTKSHLDARQAESCIRELADNKFDSITNDILISEKTAIKIADRLFTERYGKWRNLLWKPFDVFLINGYWLVYGPVSKSEPDGGPIVIINQHTGATRFKP